MSSEVKISENLNLQTYYAVKKLEKVEEEEKKKNHKLIENLNKNHKTKSFHIWHLYIAHQLSGSS